MRIKHNANQNLKIQRKFDEELRRRCLSRVELCSNNDEKIERHKYPLRR
jgi:hypothetical protein